MSFSTQAKRKSLVESLGELVTCAVCHELLKKPKVFPCLHSYCYECIVELAKCEDGLLCPECRSPVEIGSPPDLSSLPTNFFANNVLATLSLHDDKDAPALVCDNCEELTKPVEKRCRECVQFLCAPCVESHQRSCETKNHVLLSKDELRDNEPAENAKPVKCSKHNEILKFFCDSCGEPICMVCTVLDHKQHNLVSLKDAADKATKDVRDLVERVEERMETICTGITLAVTKCDDINEREKACSLEIEEFFAKLLAAIEDKKQNLLAITATAAEGQRSQVKAAKEVLELAQSMCRDGVKFAEQTLENGSDVQMLNIKPTITQYLDNLKDVQDEIAPNIGSPVRFLKSHSLTEICEQLSNTCAVEEANICLEKCEAKLPDPLLKVGKKSVIVIICNDKTGRTISSGCGKDLIEPSFTGAPTKDVNLTSNQNGTHEISFVTKELGMVQFEAKINGRVAPGCSLKADVRWEFSDKYGSGHLVQTNGTVVDCMSGQGDVGVYCFRLGDTPMVSGTHHWKVEISHAVQHANECFPEGPTFEVGVIEASNDYSKASILDGEREKWIYSGSGEKIANVFLHLDMEKRSLVILPGGRILVATAKFSVRRKTFDRIARQVLPFFSVNCPHCSLTICKR